MSSRNSNYNKKSRRLIAWKISITHHGHSYTKMNGVLRDIGKYYIDFLEKLDNKEAFRKFAHKIRSYSDQWNGICKKCITSCIVKRLLSWKGKSDYIYSFVSKYINGKIPNRGMQLEDPIRSEITSNDYDIKYENQL